MLSRSKERIFLFICSTRVAQSRMVEGVSVESLSDEELD